VLLGEGYSPNLGDQMIREALAYMFSRALPEVDLVPLDWSGRQASSTGNSIVRTREAGSMAMIQRNTRKLINPLRPLLTRRGLLPLTWPRIAREIRHADFVLIGGGELIRTSPALFPDRMFSVCREARNSGKPFGFIACGVNPKVNARAQAIAAPVLRQARFITVRDRPSRNHLRQWVPDMNVDDVVVAPDPAVLIDRVHPVSQPRHSNCIGVNVVACHGLQRHDWFTLTRDQFLDWYGSVVASVHRTTGLRVGLFTNGDPSDQAFAESLLESIDTPGVYLAPRPHTPDTLSALAAGFTAVVASRFHCMLAAYAFGVPCVGLCWSPKISAFLEDSGHAERSFRIGSAEPHDIGTAIQSALSKPHETCTTYRDSVFKHAEILRKHLEEPLP
jgi:polysaccharide pyruvyl transferase WcaK-like protein